jgi:hypothetical protein
VTPLQVRARVQALFAPWVQHLSVVIQTNPARDISELFARPDLVQMLGTAVLQGRSLATTALWQDFGAGPASPYRDLLQSDIMTAYETATADLLSVATAAFDGTPQALSTYEGGTSSNVPSDTAEARASAVRHALQQRIALLGLRNSLTVSTGSAQAATEAVLAEGRTRNEQGEQLGKMWAARMDGKDPASCAWCRALHGMVLPLDQEFPHGGPLEGHQPPKVYHSLLGPPRHPNCRCRIVLVPLPGQSTGQSTGQNEPGLPVPPAQEHLFGGQPESQQVIVHTHVSAAAVRRLPEQRYNQLLHFVRAATHELGQILRRLAGMGH